MNAASSRAYSERTLPQSPYEVLMHTILIADDEGSIRTLIETTLESPGCRLLLAENGSIAFEIASREIPDLIVLDWMMPSMTGLEVADRLRQESRTAKIPI